MALFNNLKELSYRREDTEKKLLLFLNVKIKSRISSDATVKNISMTAYRDLKLPVSVIRENLDQEMMKHYGVIFHDCKVLIIS
jgi:hypothetical protein